MAERQLQDFHRRRGRYERAYARGRSFEAAGTLGRVRLPKGRRVGIPIVAPLCLLVGICLVMKAAIPLHLGSDLYAERLERLQTGSGMAQLAARMLAPDPVSSWIAVEIERLF